MLLPLLNLQTAWAKDSKSILPLTKTSAKAYRIPALPSNTYPNKIACLFLHPKYTQATVPACSKNKQAKIFYLFIKSAS